MEELNEDRVNNLGSMLSGKVDMEEVTTYEGLLPVKITPAMLNDDTVHGFTWREMLEACRTAGVVEELVQGEKGLQEEDLEDIRLPEEE